MFFFSYMVLIHPCYYLKWWCVFNAAMTCLYRSAQFKYYINTKKESCHLGIFSINAERWWNTTTVRLLTNFHQVYFFYFLNQGVTPDPERAFLCLESHSCFAFHLAGFRLVLQKKPGFIWRLKTSSVCGVLAPRGSTECRFSQSRDGYWVNTTDKYNDGRLDTCIIARAIRYACRHTPHLKHCRQQESFAACQPWLMWSISKPGEMHQGKLLRERLAKTLLPRTRMWLIFMHFFPHLSPDPPRCFVSQELWAISLMRKLILQQPHPAP